MAREAARADLLRAALSLVEKGLVARTWGNISLRISPDSFLISPSGIPYEDLAPEDFVELRQSDLNYSSALKPSSEKGLHAMVYRARPEIGAIVHTHQFWASAVAVARRSIPADGGRLEVPCARYALPTTKALTKAVARALHGNLADAVLLANHGALCLGKDLAGAIMRAEALETQSRSFILESAGTGPVGKEDEARLIAAWGKERGGAR